MCWKYSSLLSPFDRVNGHLIVRDQGGGDIILRAERIAGAEGGFSPARQQHPHQIGGFGGDVHGGSDANALERLLFLEALFDKVEHGHLFGCPVHAESASLRQVDVSDVVIFSGHEWLKLLEAVFSN